LYGFPAEARTSQSIPEPTRSDGRTALALLEQALEILDAIEAPGDIGAHVDLAISRLRDVLRRNHGPGNGADSER
jgi:hypothetical protein